MSLVLYAALLVPAAFAACSVDGRSLVGPKFTFLPPEGGSGGEAGVNDGGAGTSDGGSAHAGTSSNTGGSTDGGSAGSGTGGTTAGSIGSGGVSSGGTAGLDCGGEQGSCGGNGGIARCPDLDGNRVLDCNETLALNPTFDANSTGWIGQTGLKVQWLKSDAHAVKGSGSITVENQVVVDQPGDSIMGASQCLSVSGGLAYHFAVEVSIPSDAEKVKGGIQLLPYDSIACTGNLGMVVNSNLVSGADWGVAELTYVAFAETRSIQVKLVTLKPIREPAVSAQFDNVLVRTE